jgi:Uma2 family endonuclease
VNVVLNDSTLTPDELLRMPDGKHYELLEGRLVEKQMGAKASYVSRRCAMYLGEFCEQKRCGWLLESETGYHCFPRKRKTVRKPDISFIRLGRLENEEIPDGHVPIPPDLAVEVVSPNDLAYEVDEKLLDYRSVGVPLVWVINPKERVVWVHHGGVVRLLTEADELTGEDVLPGFRCPVRNLFLPPAPDATV